MKTSEIIRKHYEEIVEAAVEMEKEWDPYQVDLYLYPDGTIDTFVNIGGNSWLNDDHITVYRCDHQNDQEEEPEEWESWMEDDLRASIEGYIESVIWEYEQEEKYNAE